MNHDNHSQDRLTPELEARVVAWVLGESSPEEALELARRCTSEPALAEFKAHIEAVHGLLTEAEDSRLKMPPAAVDAAAAWRLSPDRRAALLAAISNTEPRTGPLVGETGKRPGARGPGAGSVAGRASTPWRMPGWAAPLAACVALLFVVGQVLLSMGGASRKYERAVPDQTVLGSDAGTESEAALKMEMPVLREPELATVTSAPAPTGAREAQELASAQRRSERAGPVAEGERLSSMFKDGAGADAPGREAKAHFYEQRPDVPQADVHFGVAADKRDRNDSLLSSINRLAPGNAQVQPAPPPAPANPWASQAQSAPQGGMQAGARGLQVTLDAFSAAQSPVDLLAGSLADTRAAGESAELAGAVFSTATPAAGAKIAETEDLPRQQAPAGTADFRLRREVPTAADPVSTFSLHVGDASFRLARAALARGELPDPATVRPEEFYNAFDYGDPGPGAREPVAGRVAQAAHPFLQQRNLVRIALKVPAAGRSAGQPLRLTVLLDTSGSMVRADRAATVQRAFAALGTLLGPADRVTLIGFARRPRLIAVGLPGDQASRLNEFVAGTPAEGGTNLEEALKVAGEQARAQFEPAGQNRIVLLTDGAANLGDADPAGLAAQVVALRQAGIAFDACGVGAEGLDDGVLEALTREGDGRYLVINSPEEADTGFARQLAGAFRPAAENVKLQVRFNPARVSRHRLIGFEQHRLREQDFRDDRVDAAELAGEEGAVALYQVEVRADGEGELGEVLVRFRDPTSGATVERSWAIGYVPQPPPLERATPSLQLAATAAFLAEKLRGGDDAGLIRLEELTPLANLLRGHYADEPQVQELLTMLERARRLLGP